MGEFIEVLGVDELNDGEMTSLQVDDHEVLVARVAGKHYVTDARCPHLHGRLVKGTLEGAVLTCPVHGSQFDVTDGSVVRWTDWNGMALSMAKLVRHPRPLRTYEVLVEDGKVFVGPERSEGA